MLIYICMHCRVELYKEDEEERQCEDHPWSPADKIIINDDLIDPVDEFIGGEE